MIYIDVLLPLLLSEPFTYMLDSAKIGDLEVKVGDVVKVPFRNKELWGLVWKINDENIQNPKIKKIKEVICLNESIKFEFHLIEFINWIADYNLAPKGLVLKAFLNVLNSSELKKTQVKPKQQIIEPTKFNLKKLSARQEEIASKILTKIKAHQHFVNLIDGVTGSGKTEIYFLIIAKLLSFNPHAQILILLPEIALTSQLVTRFKQQFGFSPFLWHSKITKKEKREIFYGLNNGNVKVLIGARSSLLLPFKNLQLIIVDEEHDSSFKQEDVFNFNARDMAILKAKIENFSVILGSATPSIESYVNAKSGKYEYFLIDQKFNQQLSDIKIIDLKRTKLATHKFISEPLKQAINHAIENNKQTLLFLNRRGYAPITLCSSCGQKVNCPNCSSYLVNHKYLQQLICHYCNFSCKSYQDCKICLSQDSMINLGAGVERIKEEVEELFPEIAKQNRIALMTSDNISNFNEAESLIKKITANEIDIIIGTQLISKGYDFANLNLVGIIDADSGFYNSDLRAIERSYQLLTQVIGRAGRGININNSISANAKTFIQTYNPENLIFEKIINNKKEEFYNFEINNRKSLNLPPFSKMAAFIISSFEESAAINFAKKLVAAFPFNHHVELFGPAPMPIIKVKNRCFYRVFLKTDKKIHLQKLILDVTKTLEIPKNIRFKIDIDPL
jgi:primosomal protein N' (replication factor Y)